MTTAAPAPDDVLAKVDTLGPPGTPVTTPEVAEGFDCTKRTVYNRLNSLAEDGVVRTKKVGANSRVWWRPPQEGNDQREDTTNGGEPDLDEARPDWEPSVPGTGGEMAERIREFEWAETSLGPMAEWPQELRTAVDIMLGADEAIGIYWGDDLVLLYNDAWRELIGTKHPAALGEPARDVFPEIWEAIEPMFAEVLAGEGAAIDRERLLPLRRNGRVEDAWFDYSANPIPTDDGSVGGIFNVAVDVTDRVRTERTLHETNERLEVALTAAGMGTWEWDLGEGTVRADETMLSLFDMSPTDEPLPVERYFEKMSPEGVSQCETVMESTFEPGEELQDEIRLDYVDDPPRWVTWRGRASQDDPSVLHGVSFDVTERKQAEIEREQAMEALQESEARYHSLFEEMDEGFALCELAYDDDGRVSDIRYVELNEAFEDLTGVSRDEAEGRLAGEVFPGQDESFFETYERVAETGVPERVENYVPANDRWYEVRMFPREGDTVAVLYDDITERKEDELHREERYRTLFESINEGFCIVEVLFGEDGEQEDYRFLATNPAFEEITGLTDVDGKLRRDLETGYDPQFFNLYGEVARTGEAKRFQASGEPLIEGWYDIHAFPYGESDSNKVALLIENITERKEMEEELRRSEERLKAATSAAEIGIWELDLETDESLYISPSYADILGYDEVPADWTLERALDHYHPEDRERLLEYLEDGLGERTFESPVVRTDGEERWILVDSELYTDRDGDPVRAVGTMQDVTEQKHRERRDQFLLELSDRIRALESEEAIGESCTEHLAEELGLDRAYFVRFFPDDEEALVGPEYHSDDLDPVSGLYPFSAFPEATRRIQDGTLVFDDTANADTLPETERQALLDLGFGAYIAVPIQTDDDHPDWGLYAVTGDPHDWTDAEVSLVEEAAERTWSAVERARAQQKLNQSNQSLERLNDVSRELIDADPETIRERVAELVVDVLDVEHAALWRYDGRTGDLERDSEHAVSGTDLDAIRPSDVSREDVWDTFVDDEIHVEDALDVADGEWPFRSGSRVFVPLGRHGVVVADSVDSETFDDRLVDLVSMVAATVETVWDRAESEQELELRNEELTRLDRLNTLIRTIDQALVAADTREEIDEAVCERLADSELYEFAWVGEHDPGSDRIEPRAWAGVDSGYLEDISITVEETPTNRDPIARAVRTGDLQVVADIATDSGFAPWREATLERGARSVVCIPLVYDETVYGVLTVYADQPQSAADERNHEVLSELGATIAHAINARETRATLQTDSVVELTLGFEACETPLCRLAREADCQIDYQGHVSQSSGHADVFFIAREVDSADLQARADDLLAFEEVHCLTERGDGALFRARLSDPTLAALLTDAGAVVRSITIDTGVTTAVVDIPHTAAVREFLDQLRRRNADFELRARQSRERPLKTRQTFVAALEDRLTDRQREVLQTAYLSGFFEVPRVSNGQEVTELLGVSQPTFSEHLRTAQRRLCEVLFERHSPAEMSEGTSARHR